jgi:hypothetical protein
MKKFLSAFSVAFVMNACNTAPKTAGPSDADTIGLAIFQLAQAQHAKDSIAQWTKDSINRSFANKPRYVSGTTEAPVTTVTSSESSHTATQSRVSKTAKGAIIGGVVGAGTGAIINKKNRAAGAVVGGVVGAGTGAVIGSRMDKRDGRQ